MTGRNGRVIVASSRAATGAYLDTTGPTIVEWLTARGYSADPPIVVSDGAAVGAAIRGAIGDQIDVIITTGGTGIHPQDQTPEQTRPLLDRKLPGIIEALRTRSAVTFPPAMLTRGYAGVAGRSFVVNLPGSAGGVSDGLAVLDPIRDHIVEQLAGGDHG